VAHRLALGLLVKTLACIAAEALPDGFYVEEASTASTEVAQQPLVVEVTAAAASKLRLRADR